MINMNKLHSINEEVPTKLYQLRWSKTKKLKILILDNIFSRYLMVMSHRTFKYIAKTEV